MSGIAPDIGTAERAGGTQSREPHWRRIAEVLAAEIQAGVYPPAAPMPTVIDFAERFAVNRHTVRQALASLQARGLVSMERGRGTFIVERNIDYRLGRRVRFRDNLSTTGLDLRREILDVSERRIDERQAIRLDVTVGAPGWWIKTRSFAGRHPFSVAHCLLSAERFTDFPDRLAAMDGSITKTFETYGFGDYVRQSTRIEARAPEGDEAGLLMLPQGVPVLASRGLDATASGEPLQAVFAVFAGHRVRFLVEPEALLDGELF